MVAHAPRRGPHNSTLLVVALVAASGAIAEGNTIVPIDVLFKKSFELGSFNPYVGVGPSVSIDIEDGEAETSAGCAFAAGTYFWLSDHVGIDFDVEYSLVSKNGTAQDLVIAVGPVLRF